MAQLQVSGLTVLSTTATEEDTPPVGPNAEAEKCLLDAIRHLRGGRPQAAKRWAAAGYREILRVSGLNGGVWE